MYPLYPDCQVPTLIFHGTHDDLVPVGNSLQYAEEHSNARLITLDSGHELTDVLEEIWIGIEALLPAA
jgi:pimeloyl-ACP methyl ester carboxylesterase